MPRSALLRQVRGTMPSNSIIDVTKCVSGVDDMAGAISQAPPPGGRAVLCLHHAQPRRRQGEAVQIEPMKCKSKAPESRLWALETKIRCDSVRFCFQCQVGPLYQGALQPRGVLHQPRRGCLRSPGTGGIENTHSTYVESANLVGAST